MKPPNVLSGALALFVGVLTLAAPSFAEERPALETLVEGCIRAAGAVHRVPAGVLVLLLNVEGGRLGAVSKNANGTVDIGPMQVNDIWVEKVASHWRASPKAAYAALRDSFCANVEGGAWILRQALDEAGGNLWEGVALYHSHAPVHKQEYLRQVFAHAMRLKRQAEAEGQREQGARRVAMSEAAP